MSPTLAAEEPVAVAAEKRSAEHPAIFHPEKDVVEQYIVGAIFVLSFAYLCLFRTTSALDRDEGIILQGANRILHGQVLYRDFFSFYTPGSYYFVALLFRLFGNALEVARTALVFFGAIYSVITYLLARRVTARATALFIAALVLLTTLPFRFMYLHNWDSTLWACLTIYAAVRLLERPSWAWGLAAGSFLSLTGAFEQSKGAGLALGMAAGWLAITISRRTIWLGWREVAGVAIGLLWPIIVIFSYFALQHSLGTMWADLLWPLHHYSVANRVSYGDPSWPASAWHNLFRSGPWLARIFNAFVVSPSFFITLLPIASVAMFAFLVQLRSRVRTPANKYLHYLWMSAALSGLFSSILYVRTDTAHFVYLMPLFGVVMAWAVGTSEAPRWFQTRLRPALTAYIVIAFFLMGVACLFKTRCASQVVLTRHGRVAANGTEEVIQYIQANAAVGEHILVYPYLPFYYYLTDTNSPSELDYFQLGMHSDEQASEIITGLSNHHVRLVLFEPFFAEEKIPTSWPATPRSALLKHPVDDYILQHYHKCADLRSGADTSFVAMIANDTKCPASATQVLR